MSGPDVLAAWWDRIAHVMTAWVRSSRPLADRDQLRKLWERLMPVDTPPVLILAFGSLARGEPARDADVLVIIDEAMARRVYRRVSAGGVVIDLNVAGQVWLQSAWKDVEWGYCLSESYVLFFNSRTLEAAWRRAANSYWRPVARWRRVEEHQRLRAGLLVSARRAHDARRPLLARLLLHEAHREAAIEFIGRWGNRPFSHRSFVAEIAHGFKRANAAPALQRALLRGIVGTGRLRDLENRYITLRQCLSTVLRGEVSKALGYDTSETRDVRIASLIDAAGVDRGNQLESELLRYNGNLWLPVSQKPESVVRVLERVALHAKPAVAAAFGSNRSLPTAIPIRGDVDGARWATLSHGRLKLIVATGGCRIPSCSFCALPLYGRGFPRHDVAVTVEQALSRYRPRELALYNDGSLLNEAEVPTDELLRTCRVIRHFGVERLWIESVPRFVHTELVRDVRETSGVSSLVVGMGLQWVGNWSAIADLGRPDVDALFDRAIDVVHDANGEVRLYLLWGYGRQDLDFHRARLRSSLQWCFARNVEEVTVCPYVPPNTGVTSSADVAELEVCLSGFRIPPGMVVNISLPERASCAPT